MIVPDANLLLYAYDASSPHHSSAAKWWEDCLNGNESVGLCEVVIYAFLRISTNARAFISPLSVTDAAEIVKTWLEQPNLEILSSEKADVHATLDRLVKAGVGGNLTTDAQIATLATKHSAVVHTADTDFARFPRVPWKNPLLEE